MAAASAGEWQPPGRYLYSGKYPAGGFMMTNTRRSGLAGIVK